MGVHIDYKAARKNMAGKQMKPKASLKRARCGVRAWLRREALSATPRRAVEYSPSRHVARSRRSRTQRYAGRLRQRTVRGMRPILLFALLAACGGESAPAIDAPGNDVDAPGIDAPGTDAPPGAFAITSPMLVEGASFDAANTCNGANTSPQLDWAGAPAGAQSRDRVTDKSNNLIHWVIYDIPVAATGLANVEKVFEPANVPGAPDHELPVGARLSRLCPPSLHLRVRAVAINAATRLAR
jgi:hypothetical protein